MAIAKATGTFSASIPNMMETGSRFMARPPAGRSAERSLAARWTMRTAIRPKPTGTAA